MKTTANYLDELKAYFHVESDYALAKCLGVTRQRISNYRTGVSTFDNDMAMHVGKLLKCDPGVVLLHMMHERAAKPAEREEWKSLARKVAVFVAPAIGAALMLEAFNTQVSSSFDAHAALRWCTCVLCQIALTALLARSCNTGSGAAS